MAKDKQLKAIPLKQNGKYISLIFCSPDKKKELLGEYVPPVIPKDYEEDDTQDLNMILDSIKQISDEVDKALVAKILVSDLKSLTNKKKIITVFNPDKSYIRKIGSLTGEKFNDMMLQVSGDFRGMTIWNTLPLKSIQKLKV